MIEDRERVRYNEHTGLRSLRDIMYHLCSKLKNRERCIELFAAYKRNQKYQWIDYFHRANITAEDRIYIKSNGNIPNLTICDID